jgi:hypothetical protein
MFIACVEVNCSFQCYVYGRGCGEVYSHLRKYRFRTSLLDSAGVLEYCSTYHSAWLGKFVHTHHNLNYKVKIVPVIN